MKKSLLVFLVIINCLTLHAQRAEEPPSRAYLKRLYDIIPESFTETEREEYRDMGWQIDVKTELYNFRGYSRGEQDRILRKWYIPELEGAEDFSRLIRSGSNEERLKLGYYLIIQQKNLNNMMETYNLLDAALSGMTADTEEASRKAEELENKEDAAAEEYREEARKTHLKFLSLFDDFVRLDGYIQTLKTLIPLWQESYREFGEADLSGWLYLGDVIRTEASPEILSPYYCPGIKIATDPPEAERYIYKASYSGEENSFPVLLKGPVLAGAGGESWNPKYRLIEAGSEPAQEISFSFPPPARVYSCPAGKRKLIFRFEKGDREIEMFAGEEKLLPEGLYEYEVLAVSSGTEAELTSGRVMLAAGEDFPLMEKLDLPKGELTLEISPREGELALDGVPVKDAPGTPLILFPGKYDIGFTPDDPIYAPDSWSITIEEDDKKLLNKVFLPMAILELSSSDENASFIFRNNKKESYFTENSEIIIPPGEWLVQARGDDYVRQEKITIEAGESKRIEFRNYQPLSWGFSLSRNMGYSEDHEVPDLSIYFNWNFSKQLSFYGKGKIINWYEYPEIPVDGQWGEVIGNQAQASLGARGHLSLPPGLDFFLGGGPVFNYHWFDYYTDEESLDLGATEDQNAWGAEAFAGMRWRFLKVETGYTWFLPSLTGETMPIYGTFYNPSDFYISAGFHFLIRHRKLSGRYSAETIPLSRDS